MSTFNIIGVILLAFVVVSGTILKILFRKRREKLEGVHGFVHEREPEKTKTDEWETL